MGGTSAAAEANEQAQTEFYKMMQQEQTTTFGESQSLLDAIKGSWDSILAAGPGQLGYTPEENTALRTGITDTGATATANAINSTDLRMKQQGGGANVLPTGAGEALTENATVLGNQSTAEQLNAETAADYAQGLTNFNNATTVLSGTAGLENPVGTANATTGAGSNATSAINLADTESSQPLNTILGGIAGGITNIPRAITA